MSTALDLARARFEATPRALDDDELARLARGDRGCLLDLLSGLAAIALVSCAILGAQGTLPFAWTYVAAGVWIASFVGGTVAQTRSGKVRKAALEHGALVLGVVLTSEAWLRRPGKRVGRALVVLSSDPTRRYDRGWLDEVVARIEAERAAGQPGERPWARLLDDPDAFGIEPVELSEGPALEAPAYLAAMHVHPDRLDGGYLGYAEDRQAAEAGLDLDAPTRAPTVVAIVDLDVGFIEQVPHTPALPEADSD